MANQIASQAKDLMLGAGELYFKRIGDANGFHHLGNVDDFSITTDVTTIEKKSSMNKRRELMASVVTAVTPTGTLTMTEYNPYNLALGLFGTENIEHQSALQMVDVPIEVQSVPGIIQLVDSYGNKYYNASNIVVKPQSATPSSTTFGVNGVVTLSGGCTITLQGTYTGSADKTIYVKLLTGTTSAGDLDGVTLKWGSALLEHDDILTGGSDTETVALEDGLSLVFNLPTSSDEVSALDVGAMNQIVCVASSQSFVSGVDYLVEEQSAKAGLVKIMADGAISKGDTVLVSAQVPETTLVTVSGANAGEIEGELLFVGDPGSGDVYTLEAWKVKIKPDGDLTGLISSGEDFGTFNLNITFIADYVKNAKYPYYKVTKVGESSAAGATAGEYDPNE